MKVYGVDQDSYSPENLFIPGFPVVAKAVVIASGQGVIARGTVIGKITATGKYGVYADAGSGGLETAKLILAEDVDATSADVEATAYWSGIFNEAALTGLTAAAKADFEGTPIFFDQIL